MREITQPGVFHSILSPFPFMDGWRRYKRR
jgi:hypothetical protein